MLGFQGLHSLQVLTAVSHIALIELLIKYDTNFFTIPYERNS